MNKFGREIRSSHGFIMEVQTSQKWLKMVIFMKKNQKKFLNDRRKKFCSYGNIALIKYYKKHIDIPIPSCLPAEIKSPQHPTPSNRPKGLSKRAYQPTEKHQLKLNNNIR